MSAEPARAVDRTAPARMPVYGTAQPLQGLSGRLRRAAYRIPDHHARHWMVLILADRVDILESRVRERPAVLLAVGLGAVAGTLAIGRARRRCG